MFIRTNSMQNVNRVTRDMQDRKVIQDSYNWWKLDENRPSRCWDYRV